MRKLHYHSDCSFFAGCEHMLVNFFKSEEIRGYFDISFSYRHTGQYTEGLQRRIKTDFGVYPFIFPDLDGSFRSQLRSPSLLRQIFRSAIRLVLIGPLFLYEVLVLYRLLTQIRPDILHVNNGGYPGALSARAVVVAARLAKVPVVLMVVNNLAVGYARATRWIDYPIDRWVARSVDLFVTGSEAAANQLRHVLRLPKSKAKAIHNGIAIRMASATLDETRVRLGLDQFKGVVFGVVALLIGRKGHRVLLEAVSTLCQKGAHGIKEFIVLIEGDGPLRAELSEFIDAHNLNAKIVLVGPEDNVINFMSVLDVLIFPSVQDEDFPNVILEAMALGKPVIASRLAGTTEQITDGVTGVLVEPRNVHQLAEAIRYLSNNDPVRAEFGTAALARFNLHFTKALAIANYLTIYKQLAEANGD